MRYLAVCLVILFTQLSVLAVGNTGIDNSLKLEAATSATKAAKFLLSKQNKDGSWGGFGGNPAYTSLAITSLLVSPVGQKEDVKASLEKAVTYILTHTQPNGSITFKGDRAYANYTTSLSIVALFAMDAKKHEKQILKGRNFIKSSQFGPESGSEAGGIGYGSNKSKSDMSNTQYALEALYITESVETEKATLEDQKKSRETWERALEFMTRCQANADVNKEAWVKKSPKEDKGGFIYSPDRSKVKVKDDSLRVYGSMTYAGLKSMIYARLQKDDPRISSCIEWISKNYTLEENPGVGLQGHYYYFHTFAKALDVYGDDEIKVTGGKSVFWRADLVTKLINVQEADGSWVNTVGRWQEKDAVLCTTYALTSMMYALSKEDLNK